MTGPVLIVEDDATQREMLAVLLRRKLGYESHMAENGYEALKILERNSGIIKLVIMDLHMPVMNGMESLEIMRQRYPALPVLMLTGSRETDDAVQAIKLGATDYLSKPFEKDRLIVSVKNALRIGTLTNEVSRLTNEKQGLSKFSDLIGADSGLMNIINIGRKAAASDIPVLITGETGTGKELFARAIHGEGARGGKPFVAVNCGAIPSQLVESTLFGHEKGAFTGATEKTSGKFREAGGGTIFLDEVGELPLDTQVKLLRVLQQKEVEPVGSAKTVPVNVRVISATNRDLEKQVREGKFREDLFFRLNVLQIKMPPLRERKQDIPLLSHHFIERFCVLEGREACDILPESLKKLAEHEWRGNIRELENVLKRALVLHENGALSIESFFSPPSRSVSPKAHADPALSFINEYGELKTIEEVETQAIHTALKHFNNNVTQAAKALGVSKSTLYRKMSEKGIG